MLTIKTTLYKFGLLAGATGFLLSSCRKQLDITPETFVSPQELYKDENGDRAGLNGIYRKMMEWKSSDYYFVGVVGTDEAKTTSFVPTWGGYWTHYDGINSYNNLLTSQNQLVQGVWSSMYKGIVNANVAIKFIPASAASQEAKDKIIGEAKFLRAVFYFQLVQFFGGVPLPTDADDPASDARGGHLKSTPEEVYQLIISDLQFASDHLAAKGSDDLLTGHATKESAMTLLGKVYLTRKEFDKAKTALEPLMTATNVALMTHYADLFKEVNENNIESLFEVQYTNENNNTNNLANTLGGWHIANTYAGGGGQVVIPTDYFDTSFEAGDERKDATLRSVFYDAGGNLVDYSWWADVGKPHMKKYDITTGVSLNGGLSSRNLYYLRYSDAILMYAEALNELNDMPTALLYLNKVRNRAGLQNLETVLGHTPSPDEFRTQMLKERMLELGFEGWRWCDLKRTGNLLTQTKAYNIDASSHMTERNELLPISSQEFDRNLALKPSDQNPGY